MLPITSLNMHQKSVTTQNQAYAGTIVTMLHCEREPIIEKICPLTYVLLHVPLPSHWLSRAKLRVYTILWWHL
jgi:hypothetical protein